MSCGVTKNTLIRKGFFPLEILYFTKFWKTQLFLPKSVIRMYIIATEFTLSVM